MTDVLAENEGVRQILKVNYLNTFPDDQSGDTSCQWESINHPVIDSAVYLTLVR